MDFGAPGGLHLNVLMNISDVPLQVSSMQHLRTERARFAHIIMYFSDVTLQVGCMEHLRTEGTLFTHIVMNLFDVSR